MQEFQVTLQQIAQDIGTYVPSILGAVLMLVVGWLLALALSALTRGILNRTSIDNRLAAMLTGESGRRSPIEIEKWAATAVFYLVLLLVLVACLNVLNLPAVTTPLTNLLNQVFVFLPKLLGAGILLLVAWVLATVLRLIVERALRATNLDERLSAQAGINQPRRYSRLIDPAETTPATTAPDTTTQVSVSETLANAVYWFVFLLFLPAILSTLQLNGLLQPVQNLLNEILAMLPNILAAGIILVVGWLLARIVRGIVTNLAAAVGLDQVGRSVGMDAGIGGQSLSGLLGIVVYALILIPTVIAALNALQIAAISQPATNMLNAILLAIPQIFAAALVLGIAYVVGRLVAGLVTSILTGFGFNNVLAWLGVTDRPAGAATVNQAASGTADDLPPPPSVPSTAPPDTTTRIQTTTQVQPPQPSAYPATTPVRVQTQAPKTPSEIAGTLVLVGIMLFAAVEAANLLGFVVLTSVVAQFIEFAGRVVLALVIFALGLYLANLAYTVIWSARSQQAKFLAQAARVAILILIGAMALQQLGIASSIVNLAFGLLFGAVAVAVAIAFGLGSREIAGRELNNWLQEFRAKQ
ncbi:mechanosensitive ion channel [Leptolyngbya sp. FACHB-261]|uniref:mechanosensitive ion channel n=1 Tax=Leptolyngbya sp. FACHB-261 TaxID=2692806 RepID=UPI00168200F1|nr:mechanosensitive ion channel [Leptolyngbya sp. FACHB-261]MBD2103601.1 mechanosensitive ion channel [Leptolyngbya sp. FACHB-261]